MILLLNLGCKVTPKLVSGGKQNSYVVIAQAVGSIRGEGFEGGDVAGLVAGVVDGSFGDEGAVGESRIVQQAAEGRCADGSFADVLMAVELGTECGLGIVAVPDLDGVEADGCANLLHGVGIASLGDDVVSGDVDVAGVEADGDGGVGAEAFHQLGDLLQLATEGELRSGGVLDEDVEVGTGEVDTGDGTLDGLCGQVQALVSGKALPTAGMEDEELRAKGQGALDLSAKGCDGVGAHGLRLAADVDEIAGVDGNGANAELGAQLAHLERVGWLDCGGPPHAWAGGEDLEGVGTDLDCAIDRRPSAAGGAEMDADTSRFAVFRHVFEATL